ncbi:hypothetical protein MGU_04066 [Metarhizium guizhouense ARSEF 977]|uniref:Uncharacterized protein n=1 Tax=Metarhizium guizhouense (strain ARSEF 977) TaxID=1276136 RepID=A0A0B4H0V7_METGA|nr:hypothetical protein MGU_04066 [Metarhizium guizhouense ARSEF 977]
MDLCREQDGQAHEVAYDQSNANGNSTSNGDEITNKHVISIEEQLNSADVSISGGSDTEASRQRDGEKGHGRSASSAKKPATFKAVSVNKTFLASKSSASGVAAKPVDKPATGSNTPPPGSSSLSSSRPRLIAKTGTGTRDSAPRFSSVINGSKPASTPDPGAVWNKNRPPEPKKFTDEELKKYGIHMASRLNEDDAQGPNKWADIDDDDDDWAPEAITWGDGTKTTLPHLDEPQASVHDKIMAPVPSKSQMKPNSPAPTMSSGSAMSRPGGLAAGRGLVFKPASQEKPAVTSKPPVSAAPTKSPWATLPPVDRASPGFADPLPLPHNEARDAIIFKPSNHPPKEIAADDFTRSSWREGSSHTNRELFNSQSGRYEPVSDRRGSIKSESHIKYPALLQRPQPSDQSMEPHGLPLTGRMSQEAPFTRRRGSSSVSTGSGLFQQKMGKNNDTNMPLVPPVDMMTANRASLSTSVESPVSSNEPGPSGPHLSKQQASQPRVTTSSPGSAFTTPQLSTAHSDSKPNSLQPSSDDIVDEVEYQKRLMRERVELARKRRQEEEAREEAAKRERIQKKLEALGPAPEKRSGKKQLSLKADITKPTQIQQRERPVSNDKEISPGGEVSPVSPISTVPSQADGPVVDSKVHSSNSSLPPPSTSSRRLSHGQESRRNDLWGGQGARADRFPSWGAGASPSLRNVWGSPDNDRGLGNGTFNPDLGRVTNASSAASQGPKGPLPIAPPSNTARVPPHSQSQASQMPSISSQNPRYGPPGPDLASKWVTSVAENDKKLSATRLTERAGRERQLMERGLTMADTQPTIKETWRPIHVPGDGTRHNIGTADVQSHQSAPWKATKDASQKGTTSLEDSAPSANAGIIGSGAPSQSRPSRFFPAKDIRHETLSGRSFSRPSSPTPPPPTMEGHPAYEGDVMRPHVSLPKPQPVVKLPPTMCSTQHPPSRSSNVWPTRISPKDGQREEPSRDLPPGNEHNWQARFHKLLHGDKPPQSRDTTVDVSSKGSFDHLGYQTSATVSLPGISPTQADAGSQLLISKPMAEECFEEQEMGSLPQIRLPHKVPDAAWQPAVAQTKTLPKKFLVQASIMEPFRPSDVHGGQNTINIYFPGMKEVKSVPISHSVARGSRGSHAQRAASRHRGLGSGARGKKETSNAQDNESNHGRTGRGGRGGYRSRGVDNWTRHHSSPSQVPGK